MKTIIAGSRNIDSQIIIHSALARSGFVITEVVCGCSVGVDRMGFNLARLAKIPVRFFPAWQFQLDWAIENADHTEIIEELGRPDRTAGFVRNAAMAKYADALVAVWDGASIGTKNMIENAKRRGLRIFVATPKELL